MAGIRAWQLSADGDAGADGAGLEPQRAALVDVGLACCTLEFEAAVAGFPSARPVELGALSAGTAIVVVISGTVTDRLAPAVLAVVDACRAVGPTSVIAFGACASSGGPYWDSYAVTKGIDQLLIVDRYVVGCPPPPEALREAVGELIAAVDAAAPALGRPS